MVVKVGLMLFSYGMNLDEAIWNDNLHATTRYEIASHFYVEPNSN